MHTIIRILLSAALFTGLSNSAYSVTYMAATGDSITAGYPEIQCARGRQAYGGYAQYLEPLLDNSGWPSTLYNYGIAGDRARFAYQTNDDHCENEHWSHNGQIIRHNQVNVALARFPNPEYMLYLFGTNDLLSHSPGTVVEFIKNSVNRMVIAGVTPIVGTILPDTRSGKEFKEIPSANALLRSWLNSNSVQIAEFYNATSNNGWKSMMSDGLHPDNSGRQFMANIWFNALLEQKRKTELEEERKRKEEEEEERKAKIAGALSSVNLLLLLND